MKRIWIGLCLLSFSVPALAVKPPAGKINPTAAPICSTLSKITSQSGSAKQKLQRFFEADWKYEMNESPEYATYVGYPTGQDRWTDWSREAIEKRKSARICRLQNLRKISRTALVGEDRLSFDLAVYRFEDAIEGDKYPGEYLLMNQMWGPQVDIADMLLAMPKGNVKDFENMISRFEKVPQLLKQLQALLTEGAQKKVTPVKMLLQKIPAQFDKLLTAKVEESPLYLPFAEIKKEVSAAEKAHLQKKAKKVIAETVYPAFKSLREFVVKEYIPKATEEIHWSALPNGRAWYAHLVRSHTTTKKTAKELHDLGLQEVSRILAEMEKVKAQAKFKGNLTAFNKYLNTNRRFYHTKAKDLLIGYRDIAKRADAELPRLFKTLPRLPYGVREMPLYKADSAPAAYYIGGSIEGARPGYFEANTTDLKGRPIWGMEVLTLHEAVPGHHLQIALAQEIEGLPDFRKFGGFTAYIEGWGLYAESLGDQMGFYQDPYSKYGQLSYEMWRAVRLVVDTGMHELGWSRDKAIEYFQAHVPKSRVEIEVEIDRYITMAGQALAYKVGELKFIELREKARAALGPHFDIREYHDEILRHGALPMDVLETSFNAWLKQKSTQIARMAKAQKDKAPKQ